MRTRRIVGMVLAGAALLWQWQAGAQEPLPGGPENNVAQADRPRSFAIPPQPLSSALERFADQAGISFAYRTGDLSSVSSPGVSGTLTPREALARLLAGTGVTFAFTGTNTVTLARADAGTGAIQLDAVRVQGYPVPSQAMIDNLPPPYAGGQVAKGGQLGILGNRDVMNTPFNQTNYTEKLMKDQQAQTLADVLINDPSVRVENSASGGVEDFNIRGFNVANGDILFSGLLGVTPTFFNVMMIEGLERVEVLKGPSAFLNGAGPAGSVGGVINTIPKRAGAEPITQFTPSYTSNAQFGGHIDFGRRFGDNSEYGVRVNAVYRNGNTPIANQTQESRLFTLGADYRGDRVRASVDFGYQYQNLQAPRWFPGILPGVPVPPPPSGITNFNNPWEFNKSENFYGAVQGEVDIVENLTAFASVGGSQRRQQVITTFPPITTGFGTLAPDTADITADKMYSLALMTGVRATFDTGPISHQGTIAYNRFWRAWYRGSGQRDFTIPESNIYNPTYGSAPNPAFFPSPEGAAKRSDTDLASVAVGDTLSVWQERLQLTLGVRSQQFNAWNYNRFTGALTSTYAAGAVTPLVGVVVKPWQNVSIYGNFIQGLQEGQTAPIGTVNAGEVFPPFMSQQYEVGVKVDWGKLTTTFAAYQITQPSSFIDPATNIFTVDGQQRNRGLEFNVFGEVTEGVRLLGGATFIDARLTQTSGGINQGNLAIGVPQFQFVAGGEWDLPFAKGLTATGRVVYNGPAYVDQMNVQQIPDWALVNVGLRYSFEGINKKPIVIRANVNNLFDANYWYSTTFAQLSPSNPRTFLLSTTFSF